MTQVISVRFRSGCKNYFFDPGALQVKMGDQVIVETAQGPEFATCTEGNHEVDDASIVKPLCAVVRMATENDRRTVELNRKWEREAFDICERKIAAHKLEMKLVSVSYNFDGSKIIFFFTADGRVDFRELVRDLAGVFRARIELRQIGVRDEAKMVGGLGICGRPFCCSQFLDGFMPVSIKMAKTQNLSLNPTKISGTCGRLMCCLKYEQTAYEDAARRMPKQESFVLTPDGPGNVKSVDLLRERVKVCLDGSAPSNPLKTYRGCEIVVLRNGKGSRDGIEIPAELPERFVEPKEEEPLPQFNLIGFAPEEPEGREETLPLREKITPPDKERARRRPHHRGGRRKSSKSAGAQAPLAQKPEGEKKPPAAPSEGGAEGKRPRPNPRGAQPRPEKKPAPAAAGPAAGAPPRAPQGGEGGQAPRRHRPRHRGGRRKSGGEGPKQES